MLSFNKTYRNTLNLCSVCKIVEILSQNLVGLFEEIVSSDWSSTKERSQKKGELGHGNGEDNRGNDKLNILRNEIPGLNSTAIAIKLFSAIIE